MLRTWLLPRTLLALGLLTAIVLGVQMAGAPPAHADSDDWTITRYDVQAQAQPDGTVDVQLDFDFDFGDDEGHGPYLTFITRQEIEDDRSEEHTSELQSRFDLVCRLLLEKKNICKQ